MEFIRCDKSPSKFANLKQDTYLVYIYYEFYLALRNTTETDGPYSKLVKSSINFRF